MRQGRTLESLEAELARQYAQAKDFKASTRKMTTYAEPSGALMMELEGATFGIQPLAHQQMRNHLRKDRGIPFSADYYNYMLQNDPDLLATNLNWWLATAPPDQKRLVRTLDGNVRAVLSDRYRPLDNLELWKHILPELRDYPDLRIVSCELTESKMYVKLALTQMVRAVKVGDEVMMGILFKNSEVGASNIAVLPFVTRLVCMNGATYDEYGKKRHHVGRAWTFSGDEDEGIEEFITDETRKVEDAAFFLKLRDVTRAVLSEQILDKIVGRLREASGVPLPEPEATVEVVAERSGMTEEEMRETLRHLREGMDYSIYGLHNAVTRMSADVDDYDRASELERLGGKIIELNASEWRVIAQPTTHPRSVGQLTTALALPGPSGLLLAASNN